MTVNLYEISVFICTFDFTKKMIMQLSGKLISILPEVHGDGRNGPWKKQEFIVETEESYPKKICISSWNDRVELNQDLLYKPVKVEVTIESREFNGRWYTDVRAVSMQVEKPEARAADADEQSARRAETNDEITEDTSNRASMRMEVEDDLPF